MPPKPSSYWQLARAPRYSVLFALPLLLAYETLAFALTGDAIAGVRNGADVLLKSVFVTLGGRRGLVIFGFLLLGSGAVLVYRDLKRGGRSLRGRVFAGMLVESVVYALGFGIVVGTLTANLLRGLAIMVGQESPMQQMGLATQIMVSLGAGLYEELLFRVLLVGALNAAGRKLLGWTPIVAGVVATLVGALIFSAFHYVGPFGDPLELGSFTFRTIAGVAFSGLYLLRGFGITAWTHALYDVFLALRV